MSKDILLVLFLATLLSGCSSNNPVVSLGSERNGFAISIPEAISEAKPHLYESFKLRNPSREISEEEYFSTDYYQIFVHVERENYMVIRDLPKKLASQHLAHPVRINMFSGMVISPE